MKALLRSLIEAARQKWSSGKEGLPARYTWVDLCVFVALVLVSLPLVTILLIDVFWHIAVWLG